MQPRLNIIAACDKNRVIGFNGKIPWHIPEDMARFKRLTFGNTIIMGRRTFQEIGKPLSGRFNIIVSKTASFSSENLMTASSLENALEIAYQHSDRDIFLCGGQKIYQQGIFLAERIYLTIIDAEYQGDTFFPEIPENFSLAGIEEINGTIPHKNLIYDIK